MTFTITKDNQSIAISTSTDPYHKRPGLYIGDEYCITRIATFTDERSAKTFDECLRAFLEMAGLQIYKEESNV